jgi:TfoX/Sxy family transcriptional regulator of competence genes
MAYDTGLAQRVREILEEETAFHEKKMFGGLCYLVNGNMACGILKDELIVRVGTGKYDDCLKMPGAKKFDITGKPMKGWVMVSSSGYEADKDLKKWVRLGLKYAGSLPLKQNL